jgi:hypothetical protein
LCLWRCAQGQAKRKRPESARARASFGTTEWHDLCVVSRSPFIGDGGAAGQHPCERERPWDIRWQLLAGRGHLRPRESFPAARDKEYPPARPPRALTSTRHTHTRTVTIHLPRRPLHILLAAAVPVARLTALRHEPTATASKVRPGRPSTRPCTASLAAVGTRSRRLRHFSSPESLVLSDWTGPHLPE